MFNEWEENISEGEKVGDYGIIEVSFTPKIIKNNPDNSKKFAKQIKNLIKLVETEGVIDYGNINIKTERNNEGIIALHLEAMIDEDLLRIIIVSNEKESYDFFVKYFPQSNIQYPVANIDEMWFKLSNGMLDINSEMVILTGADFHIGNNKLEKTVRDLAKNRFVLIFMDLEYHTYFDKRMSELVSSDGIPCEKFWYVNPDNPLNDIKNALNEYIDLTNSAPPPNITTTDEDSEMFNEWEANNGDGTWDEDDYVENQYDDEEVKYGDYGIIEVEFVPHSINKNPDNSKKLAKQIKNLINLIETEGIIDYGNINIKTEKNNEGIIILYLEAPAIRMTEET